LFVKLLNKISPYISGVNALELIKHINDLDRWSSFDKHHETALYCIDTMKGYGLETEMFQLPADGEKTYGDWVMPRAWDAWSARLTLLPKDGRREVILCDYKVNPCSLVVYSKPTPPGGVTAEVVVVEGGSKPGDYDGLDVEGKVVFTSDSARSSRIEATRHGAVGIISDHLPVIEYYRPPMELPDCYFWDRFSTDTHGGWGMKKGDIECWGFVLTPRQGHWLRELIRKEKTVKVHAEVNSRFYDGTVDVVTGYIPGETDEEVLINGHLYEVGAIDNASGCGVAIEVLRCLNELIERGELKRPKRGIRMLFTYECMGTMGAVIERPDIFNRVVAAITLDSVGGDESLCKAFLSLSHNPHAQSSYTDTLLRLIMEHMTHREKFLVNWRERPFLNADNIISDPTIGIPSPLLLEYPYRYYHTCMDTPDKLNPDKLSWIGVVAATYVYFIANAGEAECKWLIEEVLSEGKKAMIDAVKEYVKVYYESGGRRSEELWKRLNYLRIRYDNALESILRLASSDDHDTRRRLNNAKRELIEFAEASYRRFCHITGTTAEKPKPKMSRYKLEASKVVPKRLIIGVSKRTRIPADKREEWSKKLKEWNIDADVEFSAQMWCDGKRSVAEIEELVECETGKTGIKLLEYFREMEKYGYFECSVKD